MPRWLKKKRQFGSTENAAERGGGSKISKIMWKYLLESGQIFKIKKEENKFVSHIITSIHVSLMFHLGPEEHSCLLSYAVMKFERDFELLLGRKVKRSVPRPRPSAALSRSRRPC